MSDILIIITIIGIPSFWFLYQILKHDEYVGNESFIHEGAQEICDEFDKLLEENKK